MTNKLTKSTKRTTQINLAYLEPIESFHKRVPLFIKRHKTFDIPLNDAMELEYSEELASLFGRSLTRNGLVVHCDNGMVVQVCLSRFLKHMKRDQNTNEMGVDEWVSSYINTYICDLFGDSV